MAQGKKRQIGNSIRNHFLSGLAIVLPLVTTALVAKFALRILTTPFVSGISFLLGTNVVYEHRLLFYLVEVAVLAIMAISTVLIGAVTRWYVVKKMVEVGENLLNKIPFVRIVYKASREVMQSFVASSQAPFKEVVLVPFPHSGSYALAFLIKEEGKWDKGNPESVFISVFVPTTPNPTTGFILLVNRELIVPTDLSMEEGLKFVISCGVIDLRDVFSPHNTQE
ncbi:DUF502 domain-containing protein [Candidatus Similichlamydia laticola]|uniref:Transporter n=1 Tax=Candidatus Similichlamydia laticola TaxID=2170265 RepID=A0A369KA53_9BACT|nr:DUF502 domain-containing protein [Candidatus Similichlamydia laticola]RDB31479.1 hypothetical protein HAT2_00405 [Candidatus Similichlamydia laticola]